MDNDEEPDESPCSEERENSGVGSPSSSLSSSLSASQEFRRQMKAPNKKKFEEEMEEVVQQIKVKDAALKTLNSPPSEAITAQLRELKSEKEASVTKRKKIDGELRILNQEITKKMGLLSRTESNLHYKSEAKIDDAISNLEWQLKRQNFRLQEERKIVAEVDKLRRSKKVLVEYFAQKKEIDKMRESQRRMRGERDHFNRAVTNISKKEEELRKKLSERKTQSEILRTELNELYEKKRQLFADFKQTEQEYQKMLSDIRIKKKKDSIKRKEEERKAKDEAFRREMLEYHAQTEPFEDEKNLCNTLVTYLQRYLMSDNREEVPPLASPREERPDITISSAPGPADSLDDGMFVLLKKSEETGADYTITNKRPARRSKKGRKLSVTKPLAHTPQIIAQFSSLNLNAPSNMAEVPASVEQLQARKRFYEEQSGLAPMLGTLGSSFSSSGSLSSLESPLRERSSTWGYVEVPPSIAENQAPSDAGTSAGESGFHDMSRQASKTESSESATENTPCDQALEEMIRQSEDLGESEHSRSSSDTITYDDLGACGGGEQTRESASTENNNSFDSSVFEDSGGEKGVSEEPQFRGDNRNSKTRRGQFEKGLCTRIANYDQDFPPALRQTNISTEPTVTSDCKGNSGVTDVYTKGNISESSYFWAGGDKTASDKSDRTNSETSNKAQKGNILHIERRISSGLTDNVDPGLICNEDIVTHL